MLMRWGQRRGRVGRRARPAPWLWLHISHLIDLRDRLYVSGCALSVYGGEHTCRIDGSSTFSVWTGSTRGHERSSGLRLLSHIMSLGDGSRDGACTAIADMLGDVVGISSVNCAWGVS